MIFLGEMEDELSPSSATIRILRRLPHLRRMPLLRLIRHINITMRHKSREISSRVFSFLFPLFIPPLTFLPQYLTIEGYLII
jgi:hypothetical protein